MSEEIVSIGRASEWATEYLGRPVTISNISYLVQYAKVKKYNLENRKVAVNLAELKHYYDEAVIKKQESWKKRLGSDLNWALSFDQLREVDTTKHVHRLHPYKGKFIPQLVEYFLDTHVNTFKKEIFFNQGDIVLDPFMGSGTTLIQASELGLHSIGIDVSNFNCLISKVKTNDYDLKQIETILLNALHNTLNFSNNVFDSEFDMELKKRLETFNKLNFPNPEFKKKVIEGKINENEYGQEKLRIFLTENSDFLSKNGVRDKKNLTNETQLESFLLKWYTKRIRYELHDYIRRINVVEDEKTKSLMRIIVSRTARSCRATTHSDLATLREPQFGPYYCKKHRKLCTPVNSISRHLKKNTLDTLKRLKEYSLLKKMVFTQVIHGDSRSIDIFREVRRENPQFYRLLANEKISGIFTSPPYVGQIDYHEQHAYAYELFNIQREDEKEIGPLYKGQGEVARKEYVEGVSKVLSNMSRFIKEDGNYFIVANDKFNLYPQIAKKSGLVIVNQFKRPVLNRTERDRQPYSEIIFHMKKDI
jgi:DNA modification methylase